MVCLSSLKTVLETLKANRKMDFILTVYLRAVKHSALISCISLSVVTAVVMVAGRGLCVSLKLCVFIHNVLCIIIIFSMLNDIGSKNVCLQTS